MIYRITTTAFLACIALSSNLQAELFFRGLPLYQQGNSLTSPVLGRPIPYGIDMRDDFTRDGLLQDTVVDGHRIGFVPPFEPVPPGPLTGLAADLHGRWMPALNPEYITSQGHLRRQTGNGIAVACLAWRVFPQLGDEYLIQMTTDVAPGEEVRIAYMGDSGAVGTSQGFDGPLGQLVFAIERRSDTDNDPFTTAEDLVWTIAWDVEGNRQVVSGSSFAPVGEALQMQLGWLDEKTPGMSDRFDAWLATSQRNQRLSAGNMNIGGQAPIEVFGVGVEIRGITGSGSGSRIDNFIAAVPEPAAASTSGLGLFTLAMHQLTRRRRRRSL